MKSDDLKPKNEDKSIELQNKIDELQSKIDELNINIENEKKLSAANMINTKKRYANQIMQAEQYAIEKFALDMLATLEALEIAIKSIDQSQEETIKGLEMASTVFSKNLEKHGINKIVTDGQIFNPEIHIAVKTEDNEKHKSGAIISTLQAGYMINDRVLKAAMVIVAS